MPVSLAEFSKMSLIGCCHFWGLWFYNFLSCFSTSLIPFYLYSPGILYFLYSYEYIIFNMSTFSEISMTSWEEREAEVSFILLSWIESLHLFSVLPLIFPLSTICPSLKRAWVFSMLKKLAWILYSPLPPFLFLYFLKRNKLLEKVDYVYHLCLFYFLFKTSLFTISFALHTAILQRTAKVIFWGCKSDHYFPFSLYTALWLCLEWNSYSMSCPDESALA